MINRLTITKEDLPDLVGKIFVSKRDDDHKLFERNSKDFLMEKRVSILVCSNKHEYGLAGMYRHVGVKLYSADEFVTKFNNGNKCLATPSELRQIHQWMLEDLEKL